MKTKAVSGIMLTLLLTSMLILAFNIQPVKASGTIYIKADGRVEGTTHITSVDNITYTFTGNIYDEIVVEKDNIVVDGASYTLQPRIDLIGRSNVTIKNTEIKSSTGPAIYLGGSSNNTISGNKITGGWNGIALYGFSNYNTISGNKITEIINRGITLYESSNNTISGNNIKNNGGDGIMIAHYSNYNTISGNNITNNNRGIHLEWPYYSSNNKIHHNNIIDNTYQVVTHDGYMNIWDDGYPSGGNYWSDHVTVDDCCGINQDELGSDGIVDEPYVIDDYNRDNYPLVEPWSPVVSATIDIDPDALNLRSGGKWITAYIQLPEGYNAEDIDATTILLNGTIPPVLDPKYEFVTNSSEYLVDYNEDGTLERMVKFDRAEVMALLDVGEATLTITGEVDGTPFEGSDSIRVIFPFAGCRHLKR